MFEIIERSELKLTDEIIDTKWLFNKKMNLTLKARVVAKGFMQLQRQLESNFAPTARLSSFRLFVMISRILGMVIYQQDVTNAFAHAELDQDTYISVPEGLKMDGRRYVLKLLRALYGLRNSPKCWYLHLNEKFAKFGLKPTRIDPTLYFMQKKNEILIVQSQVDDLNYFGTNKLRNEFNTFMNTNFKIKDLGVMSCFMAIRVQQGRKMTTLDQNEMIANLFATYRRYLKKRPKFVTTPLPSEIDEELALANDDHCKLPYQELVGSLLYIMVCTRPDLAYALKTLSRFNNNKNQYSFQLALRTLCYLYDTRELMLHYSHSDDQSIRAYTDSQWGGEIQTNMTAYSDADLAGERTTGKSTSGFVISFGENQSPIAWKSSTQKAVATSTLESEYIALLQACKEVAYFRELLKEVKVESTNVLYTDNEPVLKSLDGPSGSSKKTRYIAIRHYGIKEYREKDGINIKWISTKEMLADMMTKSLGPILHKKALDVMFIKRKKKHQD
jgi:hypothetical protein